MIFVDAIVVKVCDGQVRNTPFYVLMGVAVNGERDILGIWAGDGAEGARFWLQVFTELKNRGVEDVLIAVCYAVLVVMPMMLRSSRSVVVGGFELSV